MNFMMKMKSALFPNRCCICDKVLNNNQYICNDCEKLFIHASKEKNACSVCSLPENLCSCSKRLFYEKSSAPFFYEGQVKNSIFKFKFRGRPDIAVSFANMMFKALNERNILENTDLITFIPMSKLSEKKRGYNQSKILAQELSSISGIPYAPTLVKYKYTFQQHTLGFFGRKGNILGAFEVEDKTISFIQNKNILIVDDIITSGSTMNEAAKTLMIFGAENIFCSCVSMTKKTS